MEGDRRSAPTEGRRDRAAPVARSGRAAPAGRPARTARAARTARPTIFDVAALAGVSYSTVSRVINDQPHVHEDTRQRVRVAMAHLGYTAHVSARALASGRTGAIGLLALELESSFFTAIIRGVDEQAAHVGFDLLLCTTHDRREKEAQYVARLSHGMVDGLLIILPRAMPDYVGRLRSERFPFVIIDHDEDAPGCDVIAADNRGGARQAVAHLAELGHRRIAIITGDPVAGSSHQRVLGYRDALAAAGLPFDETLVAQGDFLEPRAHLATLQLMRQAAPPTAIFASSDLAAFGVMRAARELGMRVPDDLSVVGFDDIPEASYVGPPLTTVIQPLREMGRAGVRRLAELVRDQTEPAMRMILHTTLMVRGTTAPPPERLATRRRGTGIAAAGASVAAAVAAAARSRSRD